MATESRIRPAYHKRRPRSERRECSSQSFVYLHRLTLLETSGVGQKEDRAVSVMQRCLEVPKTPVKVKGAVVDSLTAGRVIVYHDQRALTILVNLSDSRY